MQDYPEVPIRGPADSQGPGFFPAFFLLAAAQLALHKHLVVALAASERMRRIHGALILFEHDGRCS
jgi:hypothetical protein